MRGTNRLQLVMVYVFAMYPLLPCLVLHYLYIHVGVCVNICVTVCMCVGILMCAYMQTQVLLTTITQTLLKSSWVILMSIMLNN